MTTTRGLHRNPPCASRRGPALLPLLLVGGCFGQGQSMTVDAVGNGQAVVTAREPASPDVREAVDPALLPDVGGCEQAALGQHVTVRAVRGVGDLYVVHGPYGKAICIDTREGVSRRNFVFGDIFSSNPMPGVGPASSNPMPGDGTDPKPTK